MINNSITICAGGVVIRHTMDGTVYVALEQQIGRKDWDNTIWFIPKGHVEDGEAIESAAIREVAEEVGAHNIRSLQKLSVKYRSSKKNPNTLKEIHYFLFETDSAELRPTATDKPHRSAWFPLYSDVTIGFEEQQEILNEVRSLLSTD